MATKTDALADDATVVVIGAGVLGLTTANLLVSKYPQKHIVIVAAEFPGDANPTPDYASMWAGAHYRPIPGRSPQLKMERELSWRTFEVMKNVASRDPSAGVELLPAVEYLDNVSEDYEGVAENQPFAGTNDHFRLLRKEELITGSSWGCEYQSYCVNVGIYCSWLLSKFIGKGGRVIKRRLEHAADAFEMAKQERLGPLRTIINCSGRNFDLDPRVAYIRGQTCLVRQQYNRTITKQNADGTWFALIPRPLNGGTVVGVSKEPGDPESRPRDSTRERMLRQAVQYFPDFVSQYEDFDVVSDNVGRRPWREGGLRMEVEHLPSSERRIIHGYGAGGRGYELSWGIGERLVALASGQSDGIGHLLSRL
ncbi:putative fad dependent oxidoreductase superfamily [Phaeomoniella chlamydospora]|uniref:Putative fad dependent oxidoreductase superfamily n=1 Tax=Phaeomoniella chlamydospora TaxID=158046 RepID=A0A0G2ES19_PHACM|nr:putative fad dependent oxidoreductase superfamily [Phaeomoniella chlamydospora]